MSVFTSIPARVARFALAALLTLLLLPGAAAADTVFAPADGPGGDALSDAPIEVGMKIRSSQDGFITALRFYKQPNNTGTHVGHLWAADGTQLASATYVDETASGWQEVPLPQPVAINANTTYVVSYYSPQGKFAWSPGFFTSAVGSGALTAPADGASGGNGVYKYGSSAAFPSDTWNATNYWVDAVFSGGQPSDTRPPVVSAITPADGSVDVARSVRPTATFDEPMDASTVNGTTFTLTDDLGATIPATVTYDGATGRATLTPTGDLSLGRTYTTKVKGGAGGAEDAAGNPLAADRTWSFQTSASCPCTVFNGSEGPLGDAVSDNPVEVGMKLRSSEDGWITALRFYKQPSNTGTHVGHLWASNGTKLAEVTFTNETPSGWQEEELPEPVAINANTTYITSYHAANGRYAWSSGFFGTAVDRTPLSAPADGPSGGNGVYKYGASGFPDASFGATNYWVDATFQRTRPPDVRPPRTTAFSPASDAKRVPTDSTVEVTFDEALDPLTVNTGSILLADDAGNPVAGHVDYDPASRSATLTPTAPLTFGKSYVITLRSGNAGVADVAGNQLAADKTSTFSTPPQCPCRIFDPANDGPSSPNAARDQPVEVGVRFRAAEDGYVTALRFFKQANNVGSHAGHLWGPDGQLLASIPFSGESASGWQNVDLPNPVAITKDTVYTASYYSPSGFFPFDQGYFNGPHDSGMLTALAAGDGGNGMYKYGASGYPTSTFGATNYWVDLTFERTVPPDTRGPVATEVSPAASASDVGRNANATATFDEQLAPSSVNAQTFTLRGDGGALVPAAVSYDAQTRTAKLDPDVPLAYQTSYTATLKGGAGGVTDAAGNPLTADKTWSFQVQGQPPTEGPGGPILVLTEPSDRFDTYYAEILRSEGLNSFEMSDEALTAATFTGHTTVILARNAVSDADVTLLTNWVQGGGNLIAMRPDKKLAGLLGITDAGATLRDGYLKVDQGSAAGAGIEGMTLQFHDVADRYALSGATAVATLYSDISTGTTNPAVSLRDIGTGGGQAAAFSYDLARSVIWTRQGNPAWAGQKRDGLPPLSIRPDDLFYGAKAGDVQPDWVHHDRLEVPQADEQQRLLANLITQMNLDKAPLPRLWYLPRGDKAAVVLTGDDHAVGGTSAYFDRLKASSPPGCSVADWQCVRATSYMYPNTPNFTPAQAKAYQDAGFEVALHLNTGCLDWTPESLDQMYSSQLGSFAATWPDVTPPVSNRTHCIVWSDWASQAKIERAHGIRFDTNYYYKGPTAWANKPALLTGSGFPQRFGDLDGSMIDVYQSTTQITDEMNETLPTTSQIHELLDNAVGPKNYWGVIDVILHSDAGDHRRLNELVADAQGRGVPIVTSAQMLSWLDGRNGSSFSNISYGGGQLSFSLTAHPTARGLRAMLPARSASGPIVTLKRGGQPVSWNRRTVKGVDYVMFDGASGAYTATYANDTTAPEITQVAVSTDAEGHATIRWTTDEPSTSVVEYGRTAALGSEREDAAEVTDHVVELSGLQPATTYTYKVSSTDTAGNTRSAPTATFTTPASALVDSRTAEFALGSATGTFAGDTLMGPDGEVQLQPTVGDEFNGTTVTPDLSTRPWEIGGSVSLTGGSLVLDTAVAHSPAGYAGPRVLEFAATFQPVPEQSIGLGGDLSDFPYAIFTTGSDGDAPGLYASSGANPDDQMTTPLPNVSVYGPHRFKIEWTPTTIRYFVDGTLVATHTVSIDQEIGPVASDYGLFGAAVRVHWMRMSSYPGTGTFTSRALDSGPGANVWQTLTSDSTRPTGTAITFQTRSGGTRQPDGGWSPWQSLGSGGAILSPASRFLQYRATMTTSSATATPTLGRVRVTFGAGTDRAPVAGSVALAPGSPRTNQTLTATVSGFSDPDGDPLTYHYEWFRNGTLIPGASASTLNLSAAGNGDRGDRIRVEAYASDGRGAASDAAAAKVTVTNTAPAAGTVSVRPVPAATRDLLRATPAGFTDLDGDQLTYRYQWLVNGSPVAGATNATFDVTGHVQLDDRVDVDVTAVDTGALTSPTVRGGQTITSTNATPVEGTVSITPASPKTNDVITANPSGFHDPDGSALTYHYTWSRNGTVIAGATGATLNLSQAGNGDRGDAIKVAVRATDPQNNSSETVTDTTTVATTAPTAGTVTVRPTAPAVNDTVSAVLSGFADVDGDSLTYQYQWFRNGDAIPLANGRSLNLAQLEDGVAAGDVLRVEAKALDGHGGTSPAAAGSTTVAGGNGHPVASYGFEEAAGALTSDQYGGNDGTITGADRVNNGRFGRALSFEDVEDIVKVADDSSLHLASGMTLEAWVRPTAATNWRTVVFKEAAAGLSYGLYSNNDADRPHVHIGNNGETGVSGTRDLDPNVWTHLAATYDGNILKLFVNGGQVGSKAMSGDLSSAEGDLMIGANTVWGEQFRGLIDEVRVYNRPLAHDEIAADMDLPVTPGTPRPPSDTEPTAIGSFDAPIDFPITPVHLAMLSDGRVAMWDGFEAALNSEHVFDPWTGQFDAVPTGRNLFCAGHVTLSDGRLLTAGGHIQAYEGTKDTNLFDPKTDVWTRGQDMSNPRWYPTATTLPDGRVFVVSGDNITLGPNPDPNTPVPMINWSQTLPEIYNPASNSWTSLPGSSRKMPLYPFMFVLPNGKIFDAGPDTVTRTLDLQSGQWQTVGNSGVDGQSAVMYRPGKIMKSGTWSDPEFPDRATTNRATAIDMTAPSPAWSDVAPMKYRRAYHTLTVLPDGKVLSTGGQTGTDGVDQTTGVLPAEMWDPDTNAWSTMASSRRPRLYHSSAVLLPDGRVLLAGGGAYGQAKNENSGEIYSPPYLFKGPRPQVTDAPGSVHYGQSFTVDTPDASRVQKVSLVHMGSVTHNVDMDQRFLNLSMTAGNGQVTVNGPQNANVAPPGYYMVFLIDDKGVPSFGQIVQVNAAGDTQAPLAPSSLNATAQPDGANLNWPAASDNVGVTSYRVYRSTTAGFTPGPSNRIASVPSGTSYQDRGLAGGTYYYRVKAVDKAGNLSAASPQASAVVTGDTVAPTVTVTAPTNGQSVANTFVTAATASDNIGVQSVQFKLDGQDLGPADTAAPYNTDWHTETATDGVHTITAVARDASGNATTSAPVTTEVHNTGLVAAYGFEEASGTTATDHLTHHNGTIEGGATRVPSGRFGQALSFDGTDDAVSVPDSAAFDLSSALTLEAWVRPTALGGAGAVVTKERPASFNYGLFADTAASVPSATVFTTSPFDAPGAAPLGLGTWTHLAQTWDGSTLRLYVDGAEVGSRAVTGSVATSGSAVRIGSAGTAGQFFNGLIDEVRIFGRARTPAEIATDMTTPVKP